MKTTKVKKMLFRVINKKEHIIRKNKLFVTRVSSTASSTPTISSSNKYIFQTHRKKPIQRQIFSFKQPTKIPDKKLPIIPKKTPEKILIQSKIPNPIKYIPKVKFIKTIPSKKHSIPYKKIPSNIPKKIPPSPTCPPSSFYKKVHFLLFHDCKNNITDKKEKNYLSKKKTKTQKSESLDSNINSNVTSQNQPESQELRLDDQDQQQPTTTNFYYDGKSYFSGRWKKEEHKKFIDAIIQYGNDWRQVQKTVGTRTSTQARSHAQKFFDKLKKSKLLKFNVDFTKNSLKNLHDVMEAMSYNEFQKTLDILNSLSCERDPPRHINRKRRREKSDLDGKINDMDELDNNKKNNSDDESNNEEDEVEEENNDNSDKGLVNEKVINNVNEGEDNENNMGKNLIGERKDDYFGDDGLLEINNFYPDLLPLDNEIKNFNYLFGDKRNQETNNGQRKYSDIYNKELKNEEEIIKNIDYDIREDYYDEGNRRILFPFEEDDGQQLGFKNVFNNFSNNNIEINFNNSGNSSRKMSMDEINNNIIGAFGYGI